MAVRAIHGIDQRHFRCDRPQCSDAGEEELGTDQWRSSFVHASAHGNGVTCILCDHVYTRQPLPETAGGNVRGQCSYPAALPGEPLGPEYRDLRL